MFDPLKCPTKACTAKVEITGDWQENNYCSFVEAECPQCLCSYWFIERDNQKTLRVRDINDDTDFDQRISEIR